ncbi:MAG TPA: M20/M25/M40 family metallo-hydrolase [Pyrinomonadaceae bacterium]|nr:M20/M25/M40 family metallo-hydrolase [Pyrinomonadaceae bacterium]
MLRRKLFGVILVYAFLLPSFAFGQAASQSAMVAAAPAAPAKAVYTAPKEVIDKIRDEGLNKSQVMQTLSYLSDVIGERLTGSPNLKHANEWTKETLTKWGLQNAKLEAWGPFGRGWELKDFKAEVVAPYTFPVIAYPKAWSPSTKGAVTSEVVYLDAKTDADLEKYKGKLNGKIVLISEPRELKADFTGMGNRLTDEELAKMASAPNPADAARRPQPNQEQMQRRLQGFVEAAKRANFLVQEGAAVIIDNSRNGSGGTVFVQSASVAQEIPANPLEMFTSRTRLQPYQKDAESKMIPQMTMATEEYNRLVRMIKFGTDVKMTVNIQTQYHDDDPMVYNTTAEIPGTDPQLKDQLVMLGGHMDSWHAGTGATDNGAGVAVAMEAVRILQAAGLKPRRTIRIALWTGEEQGLLGSRAYVKQHFGEMQNQSPTAAFGMGGQPGTLVKGSEYDKLSAYYNLDNGTGKIRGVYLQGNSAVAPIFKAWLDPFKDLGATTLTLSNTGGTDHLSYDAIGLPGFQFIQDEIEYDARTHHSNQDVFDRIQADDMKQAATIMAAFIYQSAMMDEKIPRKDAK